MASTYSPALRLELMATGDQSGTWGDTTNTNLGTLLEQAITGYLSVAQGDVANLTLTEVNGGTDQARNAVVEITGALTATRNVVVQTAEKLYTIKNSTTGGFSIVAKTTAGTGISVTHGTGTVTIAATGGAATDGWTKYALSYTDFSVAARVKNVNLLSLGSADFVEFAVIQVQTAFAGPGLGSFNMVLQRDGGSTVDMTDACSGLAVGNMEQVGASGRNGPNGIGLDETATPAGATTFRVRASGTGVDFNLLTAGDVWIWIKTSALP